MADREWRRDRDDYRDTSEFLDDNYHRQQNVQYDDRYYDARDYDGPRYSRHGEERDRGPGVVDRIRNWWHQNVSDPIEVRDDRRYDRDYSHGPISAATAGGLEIAIGRTAGNRRVCDTRIATGGPITTHAPPVHSRTARLVLIVGAASTARVGQDGGVTRDVARKAGAARTNASARMLTKS